MITVRDQLQIFTRRFGLLNATCCNECCGEQVSLVQSHILFEVRRAGSPAMQHVADELGLDITTFSRQIKSLEKKGLIARCISPGDRRVSLLYLTGSGRQTMEKIDRFMTNQLDQIFAEMSDFERETIVRSFERLNNAVLKVGQSRTQPEGSIACCK